MDDSWQTCQPRDALVSISTTQLSLSVRGPQRQPGQPVIICEAGAAANGVRWTPVVKRLASSARVYYYDRAGVGLSSQSTLPRTAGNMALELAELLRTADIPPPYIMLSHTYGGVITREFLALSKPGDIVGMILVDANQERTHEKMQIPFEAFDVLMENMDFLEVIGFNRASQLTPEGHSIIFGEGPVTEGESTMTEQEHFLDSAATLAEKHQLDKSALGNYPVVMIEGNCKGEYALMLEYAKQHNIGTADQRGEFAAFLGRVQTWFGPLQKEQLKLSTHPYSHHFFAGEDSGHHPQWTKPQLVPDEVLALLQLDPNQK